MKTAQELFGGNLGFYNYQDILENIGTILFQHDHGEYQGDSFILFGDGNRFGYFSFGWGSCSGCDSLEACRNINEVQELIDEFENSVKWFDSKDEAIKYFEEHDWEGDFCWNKNFKSAFVEPCLELLKGQQT